MLSSSDEFDIVKQKLTVARYVSSIDSYRYWQFLCYDKIPKLITDYIILKARITHVVSLVR